MRWHFFLRKIWTLTVKFCVFLCQSLLILDRFDDPNFCIDWSERKYTRNDPSMCYTNNRTYYSGLSGKVKTNTIISYATLNNKCCLVKFPLMYGIWGIFCLIFILEALLSKAFTTHFPALFTESQSFLESSGASDKLIFWPYFLGFFYPNCTLYREYFPLIYAPINILCSGSQRCTITNRLQHIAQTMLHSYKFTFEFGSKTLLAAWLTFRSWVSKLSLFNVWVPILCKWNFTISFQLENEDFWTRVRTC